MEVLFQMSDVVEGLSLQKTEREKRRQSEALAALNRPYSLPKNISDMKSYAWGKFTWRDVIVSGACLLVPCLIMMSFQAFIPTYVCLIIGIAIGLPLVFLANKHVFSGDLPIEQQVAIYLRNAGQSNLLSWDKTKLNGAYVPSATQSFVPDIQIEHNDYALINGNHGGFAIDQVDVEDSTMAKYTDQLMLYQQFCSTLNQCIDEQKEIPIQIYMQSTLTPLKGWMSNTIDAIGEMNGTSMVVKRDRALDYLGLLGRFDSREKYSYHYYVVTTYRDDAEGVGDKSMNTTSVRREQLKENMNPFRKKMEAADAVDYKIGDDRSAKTKEYMRASQFGMTRTNAELDNRLLKVESAIDTMGSTHTGIQARRLSSSDISRLFYEFFNDTDKYTSVPILQQALDPKVTLVSKDVYKDFPDMFKDMSERHDIYDEMIGKSSIRRGRERLATGDGNGSHNRDLDIPMNLMGNAGDDDEEEDSR